MQNQATTPTFAQTRRNLLAAASIVVAALWPRGAYAHGYDGHSHRDGSGGGAPGSSGGGAHCFLRGTLIRTPTGERDISTLAIGDLVLTYFGQEKPIKWIGRRSLRRQVGKPWSADVAPIKVVRSAFANDVPHRDLYLSPRHAVYLDGLLVTVGSLVNGSTVLRCDDGLHSLDYFHLELMQRDLVFAEGAPSETFSSSSNFGLFDNWSERLELDAPAVAHRFVPATDITGGRRQLRSRLRSALAPLVDRRTDFDKLRDRIEDRAERMKPAA